MRMKRLKTGVKEFDDRLKGGIPENSTIIVNGCPGVGKTILGLQFLYTGALRKENGLYVTFEQYTGYLKKQAEQFGWGLSGIKVLKIKSFTESSIKNIFKEAASAKRMVIDSLSTLYINAPIYTDNLTVKEILEDSTVISPPVIGKNLTDRFIYRILNRLNSLRVTTMIITSDLIGSIEPQYLCDGVIYMSKRTNGYSLSREIEIEKMRYTEIKEPKLNFEIVNRKGIVG